MTQAKKEQIQKIVINYLFPIVLLLLPLWKVNQGIDYTDSMYSLGNFRFFSDMEGMWVIATFLANVVGFLLMKLPFAGTYLGMRVYTQLIISALALISYFWLKKKIPAWLVFVGEVIAIGFCWCPTTILYNYLTYLFMLVGILFLYKGLTEDKKIKLILAGVFLGMNVMVRFPNVVETAFILAVWLFGFLKKKKFGKVIQETLWCLLGYVAGFGVVLLVIILMYGGGAYVQMMQSLFNMTDTATSYSPFEMVYSCVRTYIKGLIWPVSMALFTMAAVGIFQIKKGEYTVAKKVVTTAGILVLFRLFYAKGMFNVKYYTYPSMFEWCTTFTILTMVLVLLVLFHKQVAAETKLLYILALLTIGITPIGSNNNLYPIYNNLFLIAPVTLWGMYHVIKKLKGTTWGFPVQAMMTLVALAVLIQSIGFGSIFSFRGEEYGQKRDTKVVSNTILKGMYTNEDKVRAVEGLTAFCAENGLMGEGRKLLLFGNIPGVSYFLDIPCAISTSWPDLASYTYDTFTGDMEKIQEPPTIILNNGTGAYINEDQAALAAYEQNMEGEEPTIEEIQGSEKIEYLKAYMQQEHYKQVYANERFRVYEKEGNGND